MTSADESAFSVTRKLNASAILWLFGSEPVTEPGKIVNILIFDFNTSLSSWLTVVVNGLSAPLKTSTWALCMPETFLPIGKSGPTIIIAPFASLYKRGSSFPPGTNWSNALCATVAGVEINFSVNSSHPALVSSVNFSISGNLPVMWITPKISPIFVRAVFNHLWTSSGFLISTTCEWNLLLMYSWRFVGVVCDMKHATLPPFFSTCWAKNSTLSASVLSVASIVNTTAFPVKSGWWTPGSVVPKCG